MHLTRWINALLLALIFAGSAWAWPRLPDRIPAHFDAGGQVTRWTEPSFLAWFGIPLVALALVGVNEGLARAIARWPALVNIPGKEEVLALPPGRREAVWERVRELLRSLSALLIGLFGFMQWTTYRSALGAEPQPYMLVVLVYCILMGPVVLAVWLPRIQREVDQQVRAHRAAAQPEPDGRGGSNR